MPIEIRELVIKVKVEETSSNRKDTLDMETIKRTIEEHCKREVKKQMAKIKER